MDEKVNCDIHGETQQAYVCIHLSGAHRLGFNRNEPSEDEPYPDAWCDDCELIFQAHNGWNDESSKLTQIVMMCSGCYENACIRNTRANVTLDDLSGLRWKCHNCEEWHTGPCLDFGFCAPVYWNEKHEALNGKSLEELAKGNTPKTVLTEDICTMDGKHYFVRGCIDLPIMGTDQNFVWGVWGSLSRESFQKLLAAADDPARPSLPPMFSWLSNNIEEYPTTLNLKMYVHLREPDLSLRFELEPTDHPLSQEYHHGISPERVREIMSRRLAEMQIG